MMSLDAATEHFSSVLGLRRVLGVVALFPAYCVSRLRLFSIFFTFRGECSQRLPRSDLTGFLELQDLAGRASRFFFAGRSAGKSSGSRAVSCAASSCPEQAGQGLWSNGIKPKTSLGKILGRTTKGSD